MLLTWPRQHAPKSPRCPRWKITVAIRATIPVTVVIGIVTMAADEKPVAAVDFVIH
jgi:hypothetical protein